MQRMAGFLVKGRNIILIIFLLLALASGFFIPRVTVNYDMSRYLPDDSGARRGALIMGEQFPASGTMHLMFEGLAEDEQTAIFDELSRIPDVQHVSEGRNQDGYTLFTITIGVDIFSPEGGAVIDTIRTRYADAELSSAASMPVDILTIAIPAVIILLIILFAMCRSWFEPLIFLVNIGVAIVLNMGTNIMFESVSDITVSIAAILQLVLSMDYSIIFLNRYRQEKQHTDDKFTAMKNTLQNSFATITSIGVTTIVGMVMLVFMSFAIGQDLGLVIAKGVFMSLICVYAVMPALILMSDSLIEKSAKPVLPLKMGKIAAFCYRGRWAMLVVFIALFAATFFVRGNIEITYSVAAYDRVHQVFDLDNPVVLLYENSDEADVATLAESWEGVDGVIGIESYALTLGRALSASEIADALGLEPVMAEQLFQFYGMARGDLPPDAITLYDFIHFMLEQNPQDEMLAAVLGELDAGRGLLVGETFSRLIINTSLPLEGPETFSFIDRIAGDLEGALSGEFFLLGESAVAHEMSTSFPSELNLITILTVVAFFAVAAFAFRSFSISAILVCVIQSSVFITMASVYFLGNGIMYLALIITQALLKSRVIDYGVLYTANYIEARRSDDVRAATGKALNNSIHTIMISGLIMVTVTLVVGFLFVDINVAISEILLLVSRGCAIGVVLTVFILPNLTAALDRLVHNKGGGMKISH